MFDTNGDGVRGRRGAKDERRAAAEAARGRGAQLAAQLCRGARTEVRTMFEKHDADGEGSLDTTELQTVLHAMGHAPTEQQLQSLLGEFDYDGSAPSTCWSSPRPGEAAGYREFNEQTALLKASSPTSTSTATARSASPSCALSSRSLGSSSPRASSRSTSASLTPTCAAVQFSAQFSAQFSDALPRTHLSGRRPLLGDGILLADGEAAGAGGPHRQPAEHLEGPPAHRAEARAANLDERGARAAGARRLLSDADVGASSPAAAFAAPARAETSPEKAAPAPSPPPRASRSATARRAATCCRRRWRPTTPATRRAITRAATATATATTEPRRGREEPERARSGLKRAGAHRRPRLQRHRRRPAARAATAASAAGGRRRSRRTTTSTSAPPPRPSAPARRGRRGAGGRPPSRRICAVPGT